jgi:hypothetical protein
MLARRPGSVFPKCLLYPVGQAWEIWYDILLRPYFEFPFPRYAGNGASPLLEEERKKKKVCLPNVLAHPDPRSQDFISLPSVSISMTCGLCTCTGLSDTIRGS